MTNVQKGSNIQMTFAYDALNRCVKRTLNGNATYLCYAGWNLIEEHGSNGSLNVTYVHGANIDEMLIKTDANSTVFYHEDALGNVTYLTDKQGNLVEQYRYDAFGKPIFLDDQGNVLPASAYGNRFLFTGREWLQDIALYDYRNRIYSVELGRFQQTDPIGFDAGDVNLYRYVGNNPANFRDSNGLAIDVEVSVKEVRSALVNGGNSDPRGTKLMTSCVCMGDYTLLAKIIGEIIVTINSDDNWLNKSWGGINRVRAHEQNHVDTFLIAMRRWAAAHSPSTERGYPTQEACQKEADFLTSEFEALKKNLMKIGVKHKPGWNQTGRLDPIMH